MSWFEQILSWFEQSKSTAGERRLRKQLDASHAVTAAKDQTIRELTEKIQKLESCNRIQQIELEQLAAVVARDRSRIQAETLAIPELNPHAGNAE